MITLDFLKILLKDIWERNFFSLCLFLIPVFFLIYFPPFSCSLFIILHVLQFIRISLLLFFRFTALSSIHLLLNFLFFFQISFVLDFIGFKAWALSLKDFYDVFFEQDDRFTNRKENEGDDCVVYLRVKSEACN